MKHTRVPWSAFSWHHSSVFHCQWTHNQVFPLYEHTTKFSPVVHLVTPLSCVSLSMNTQPSVPAIWIEHVRSTRQYSWTIRTSQPMEWLHCCVCYCSLWHHNSATIAPVTSEWDTHWGALSNQTAALLVLPSSNNQHDINWMKLGFLMDEIIKFTHWTSTYVTQLNSTYMIKVITYGVVVFDNETLEAYVTQLHSGEVTKCTPGKAWSAFSWHHSSVFHCQWTHNQMYLLLSHMLIYNTQSILSTYVSVTISKLGILQFVSCGLMKRDETIFAVDCAQLFWSGRYGCNKRSLWLRHCDVTHSDKQSCVTKAIDL